MTNRELLITEKDILIESYNRSFHRALSSFGISHETLDQIKSPKPNKYSIIPLLETTCNGPADAFQLPENLDSFIKSIYPGREYYVKRIRLSLFYGDMSIGFSEDFQRTEQDYLDEVSSLLLFSNGECSYWQATPGEFRKIDILVVNRTLSVQVLKDLVKLPGLIASNYLSSVSFRKEPIITV